MRKDAGMTAKRRYDSSGRQAAAAERRERILDEAARLFGERGWAATTVADVAAAADVSAELVAQAFGAKAQLLIEAYRRVGFGGHANLQEAFAALGLADEPDLDRRLDLVVRFACDSLVPLAPLLPVLQHAAAQDARALEIVEAARGRRLRMTEELVDLLAPGETRAEVIGEIYVLTSGHTYRQFVVELGWTSEQYADWLAGALRRSLRG